jgi:hypothetical protein
MRERGLTLVASYQRLDLAATREDQRSEQQLHLTRAASACLKESNQATKSPDEMTTKPFW